ncbi:BYST protein, partial [Erythrocercus mccallii]|nr:BYST protein [Erythrocercus mccallii]
AMPKARRARGSGPAPALPLAEQILQDAAPRARERRGGPGGAEERGGDGGGDEFVDARLSRRILEQARRQQEELEAEHGPGAPAAPRQRGALLAPGSDSEDDEEWPSLEKAAAAAGRSGDYGGDVEVDPEDEKAIEMFMNKNPPLRRTLADIIMEKITEKQTEVETALSEISGCPMPQLDPRVLEVYRGVREVRPEQLSLQPPPWDAEGRDSALCPCCHCPQSWPACVPVSEAPPDPVPVLLCPELSCVPILSCPCPVSLWFCPRSCPVSPELSRVPVALSPELSRVPMALSPELSLSRIPMALSLELSHIPVALSLSPRLSPGLSLSRIPVALSLSPRLSLSRSAALLKLAEMQYSGANSVFLRLLIDKKYALPFRVLDALVFHFLAFRREQRLLPVLWHQSLLALAQRYKEDLSSEQKEALLELLKFHSHPQISPEIRRELMNSKTRDVEGEQAVAME